MKSKYFPYRLYSIFFVMALFCTNTIIAKDKLTIGVTYDMQYAIDSVAKQFLEEHPNFKIFIKVATNNELYFLPQKYDIIIFSDIDFVKLLVLKKKLEPNYVPIGYGHIAFISNNSDIDRGRNDVKSILLGENLKTLTIPKRSISSYGFMCLEYLTNIKAKELLNDKIKQMDTYTIMRSVVKKHSDYTLIPYSLCFDKDFDKANLFIPLPTNDYTPIMNAAAIVKKHKISTNAYLFLSYINNPKVNMIFKYFGYTENPEFL